VCMCMYVYMCMCVFYLCTNTEKYGYFKEHLGKGGKSEAYRADQQAGNLGNVVSSSLKCGQASRLETQAKFTL